MTIFEDDQGGKNPVIFDPFHGVVRPIKGGFQLLPCQGATYLEDEVIHGGVILTFDHGDIYALLLIIQGGVQFDNEIEDDDQGGKYVVLLDQGGKNDDAVQGADQFEPVHGVTHPVAFVIHGGTKLLFDHGTL